MDKKEPKGAKYCYKVVFPEERPPSTHDFLLEERGLNIAPSASAVSVDLSSVSRSLEAIVEAACRGCLFCLRDFYE